MVALAGCGQLESPPALEIVKWTGAELELLSLDGNLVVQFSAQVESSMKRSSFDVLNQAGASTEGWEWNVQGGILTLKPRRPCNASLSDGSLRPGERHTLVLRGLPHLDAVSAGSEGLLMTDFHLPFQTMGLENPLALEGDLGSDQYLRVTGLDGPSSNLRVRPSADGIIEIRLTGPVDPRSLQEMAVLYANHEEKGPEFRFQVLKNEDSDTILRAKLPSKGPWGYFEFPKSIQGVGGREFWNSNRRIRLLPAK